MMRTTRVIGILGFALLIVVVPLRADEAPLPTEFATTTVEGQVLDLALLRGKWVVVNFWATWCKPCRKEMPELSELHTEREDINVIGLAFEDIEPQEVQAFLEDYL